MATDALSTIRDNQENLIKVPTGDAYIDSTEQLVDINEAYEMTAYEHDWLELLKRGATVIVANVRKYNTPTRFRKFRQFWMSGVQYKEIEFENMKYASYSYVVDKQEGSFWVTTQPSAASTAYSLTNNESAGNAVTIELDTVSGLSAGEEIFVNGTTPEFTNVSSVGSADIVARLKNTTGASKILYRSDDIIHYQWYEAVLKLSAAADVTVLPDVTDTIIPYAAAYIYFFKLQEFDRAQKYLEAWKFKLNNAWLSHDKVSTGDSSEFSI